MKLVKRLGIACLIFGGVIALAWVIIAALNTTESNYVQGDGSFEEGANPQAEGEYKPKSFKLGEHAKYNVTIGGGLPAGIITFDVVKKFDYEGQECWHFKLHSKDSIGLLYCNVDSYTAVNMEHAVFYKSDQKDRSAKKTYEVTFDAKTLKSKYVKNGEFRYAIDIMPNTFCPLSVFYKMREVPLKIGSSMNIAVSDGKRCKNGLMKVLREERITIGDKSYDTVLVEPDIKDLRGVFSKNPNSKIEVWLSKDERRIPIRLIVHIGVLGLKLTADLETYEVNEKTIEEGKTQSN